MTKRKLLITTLVLAAALYSVAWVYIASYIKKVLKQEEAFIHKELAGDELILSGYPFDIKFTIKGENRQHPILRRIDAVSFNLFSRKVALHIKNDPAAKPFDAEDIEFSMKPNTDAMYYFKLNSYSMVVNYIKNKEDKLDWIDLFNLSHETGLSGAASIHDKKALSTENISVLFRAKLPGKKIYKDFKELYIDIPHHLSANLEYKVDNTSYDDPGKVPSLLKKIDLLMHPSSGKADIIFNLPNRVFSFADVSDIAKNIELKIIVDAKGNTDDSIKYNMSVTNPEEQIQIKVETDIISSKETINLINNLRSNKEEFIEFVKYVIVQYGDQVTPVAEQKLRLVADKLSTVSTPLLDTDNTEGKYNIALTIPHNPGSGKNATYNLYVGDGKKTFVMELKGEVSSVNLSNPLVGLPVVEGVLSIVDKYNGLGAIAEMKDLYFMGMSDEISIDNFKLMLDKFENNTTLWAGTFKALSDDPHSSSGEMQYSHKIDFQAPDLMKSKISKTNTLEEAMGKWLELAQERSVFPQEEAK